MQSTFYLRKTERGTRRWILFFLLALLASGLTAMPVEAELNALSAYLPAGSGASHWIEKVYLAVADTNVRYPFIGYGYDWLAFAHIVLAILFIGPLRDPVRNKWVVEFGIIACLLILPFAMIAGEFRGIPWGWRLIDCCFGIFGLIPLGIVLGNIRKMEEMIKKQKLEP